jgi:hypothetical protein
MSSEKVRREEEETERRGAVRRGEGEKKRLRDGER